MSYIIDSNTESIHLLLPTKVLLNALYQHLANITGQRTVAGQYGKDGIGLQPQGFWVCLGQLVSKK